MYFGKIVESECVEERFEAWADYRDKLTDYIIRSIEDFYIKKKLTDLKLRRLNYDYSIEDAVEEYGKPVLAIWGAGGCNDIDIKRLSDYFKLVLIDNNEVIVKKGIMKHGLDDSQYMYANLRFWDVSDADYELYEALLMEGASGEEIVRFLAEICDNMHYAEYNEIKRFNYSVVVGVASQLVSRFAALLHIYKDKYSEDDLKNIYKQLEAMSGLAVNRMYSAIMSTTSDMIIIGYEKEVLGEDGVIQGNNVLTELFDSSVEVDKSLKCISKCNLNWNFAGGKCYSMENIAYIIVD